MPSRRTVVVCLGAALATGFGVGAAAGTGGYVPWWLREPLPRATATSKPTVLPYADVQFVIPPDHPGSLAGDLIDLRVPKGWEENVRDLNGLFRDYIKSATGQWIRVRIYPAGEGAVLRPREVALANLESLQERDEGLAGYQDLGQENRGVETSDTPYTNKPCYQLRYSFFPPEERQRRRYALERFFGDGDVIYLIAGYAWSREQLDGMEPMVEAVIGSLRKTER